MTQYEKSVIVINNYFCNRFGSRDIVIIKRRSKITTDSYPKEDPDTVDELQVFYIDSDHIGGMDVILTKFECDTVILPVLEKDSAIYCDVMNTMDARRYKNIKLIVGNTYWLEDAKFTIISPNKEYQQDDHNNWSIGIKLEHCSNTFLYTGDAEKESESDILRNDIDISADVYKVAHYGSNTSTTHEFLNAINEFMPVIETLGGESSETNWATDAY